MNLLIPYVAMPHADPAFDEFTYGDVDQRARKMKSDLKKGDHVFFHTSLGGKKCITAYYIVDRVMDTADACHNKDILDKYQNPHIAAYREGKRARNYSDDAILFGDPITSQILKRPVLFDRTLAGKLSLGIKFPPNKTDTQSIGSATRAWRELKAKDVRVLRNAVKTAIRQYQPPVLRSTEEVAETLERDIEEYISHNPGLIGKGLKLSKRQGPLESGRFDLLLEDRHGNWVLVEVKLNLIGRDAVRQIHGYLNDIQRKTKRKVSGVIVCAGVLPAYQDELRKQKHIKLLVYGWDLRIKEW